MQIKKIHNASCHCGAVKFQLNLDGKLDDPRRCNCYMCSKKGAVVASVLLKDLEIIAGEDKLTLYQFNTKTAKHYFCSICGIYTHHKRRSQPHQFAFNVACLEGVDVFKIKNIGFIDGKNHPKDRK